LYSFSVFHLLLSHFIELTKWLASWYTLMCQ